MIRSATDLQRMKEAYLKKMDRYERICIVCYGTGCLSSGCKAVRDAVVAELEAQGLTDRVSVIESGCMGTCAVGPVMYVLPDGTYYTEMTPEKVRKVVREHFIGGQPVEAYTFYDNIEKKRVMSMKDIAFFKNQVRIALRNCGVIDVNCINSYVSKDGYLALARILERGDRHAVIDELKRSGLRGRGGAGFPTGVKWEAAYKAEGAEKYIICNADEGDPGAFMDRSVFEGDPHSVIEGMLIGGYAIGASRGVVYIRAEYPVAVQRLREALDMAREEGLLGTNILGSDFSFDIEIRIGAGAFVCGEETALMSSVEGRRGEPRQKPPFPFQKGLFGKPTIINNVETLANVPAIMLNGADWFRQFGTEKSPGTKVFSLSGNIRNSGLIEVPMGTPLSEVVYAIGGGIPNGRKFKAAQTGGPSGGCITADNIDVPLDYESLAERGSIVGSGGLIIMDEDTCMVDSARFYMEFIQEESCGKCTACRIGTKRMLEILERITQGRGVPGDMEELRRLGDIVKDTAMCGLGQTAPNPVLSTLRYFADEYEEHILKKYCRAAVCGELVSSPCSGTCPAGINIPGFMSLIAVGDYGAAARVMLRDNPFAGVCGRICTRPCESRCRRGTVDEPLNICELKRFATDWAYENGLVTDADFAPGASRDGSVAVVGAGPAGLTCAYYLARLGYRVDVYEAEDRPGGILAFGIPEYRLPRAVVEREIGHIVQTGVRIHTGVAIGRDLPFETLRERYDAVFIGAGAQKALRLGIPGEDLEGVCHGLDFLKRVNLSGDVDLTGRRVAVIGGGNTAVDSARSAVRLGASKVTILYRREQADMPADPEELRDAAEEGVEIRCLVNPVAFTGKDGRLTGISLMGQQPGAFDKSGRRRPVPNGVCVEEPFDLAIPAVSQAPDLAPFGDGVGVERGRIRTDLLTLETSAPGVFAGGDARRGPEDVVSAIHDGKTAAESIDRRLGGDGALEKGFAQEITDYHIEGDVVPHGRFPTRKTDAAGAVGCFCERNLGMHELDARAEAARCLRCDRR